MTPPGSGIRAPAKINLTLAVPGVAGPDGYHELRSVVARLELADELTLAESGRETGDAADSVRLATGSRPDDDLGIVLRATAALRAWARRPLPSLAIELRKRIPIAAGLGGGSSDAAATLRLAARAWDLTISKQDLETLALGLGADVPFFLGPSPIALVEGRGERVDGLPVGGAAGMGVVLVTGGRKPSTAEVFRVHDRDADDRAADGLARGGSPSLDATDRLAHALRIGAGRSSIAELAAALRDANDLYGAAAMAIPGLSTLRHEVEEALDAPAMLTGAGPTLFVLYPSLADAEAAARRLVRHLGDGGPADTTIRVIATSIASQ